MAKVPGKKGGLAVIVTKLVEGLKLLPNPARLPGFLPWSLVLLCVVIPADVFKAQNAWITFLVVVLALIVYYAWAVWLHRPDRAVAVVGPTYAPPYAVLDTSLLGDLANERFLLLITLNAASNALRNQIADVAKHVRGLKKCNSEAEVSRRLQQLLGQPELIVRSLLAWADQKP